MRLEDICEKTAVDTEVEREVEFREISESGFQVEEHHQVTAEQGRTHRRVGTEGPGVEESLRCEGLSYPLSEVGP